MSPGVLGEGGAEQFARHINVENIDNIAFEGNYDHMLATMTFGT